MTPVTRDDPFGFSESEKVAGAAGAVVALLSLLVGFTPASNSPKSPGPYVLVTPLKVGRYHRTLLSRHQTMIGTAVSHYPIVSKLGGRGMGVVYKPEGTRLHREKSRVRQT